jgi:type I restriction-modification system DNA methylase subunit
MDNDIKGRIYEGFINGYADKKGAGKEFGQFFTPRKLINLIFKLNKEIFPDQANPESIYDPCTGTGGFLTEMYKLHKLNPENIYGGELEPDTYTTGLMNLLLTTGSLCNITNGDSLANNDIKQFDWIATNPPFGMKGIKHATVLENLTYKKKVIPRGTKKQAIKPNCFTGSEMYPVKTNDGSALFLQHCITRLKYGGVCNIVLPDGQLFTGKTFMKLRKYLVDECALKAILNVPGGTFEHTGVQTAVLFFTKFEDLRTDEIAFYQVNTDCTDVVKLGVVDYDQLEAKSYVLSWNTYKSKEERKVLDSTWEIKKLGELFTIKSGKFNSSDMDGLGIIPFYSCKADNPVGFHSKESFDGEDYLIVIAAGGSKNNLDGDNVGLGNCYQVSGKTACRSCVYALFPVENSIADNAYVKWYLKNHKRKFNEMANFTTSLGTITLDNIKSFEVPIPSLEKQKEIIAKCEEFKSQIEESEATITQLEKTKKLLADTYIVAAYTDRELKKLSDVCNIELGTRIVKKTTQDGEYSVFGGGDATFTTTTYNRSGETCKISRFALSEKNCVQILNEKYFLNDSGLTITSADKELMSDQYLWYYLLANKSLIYDLSEGAAQKNLNMDKFRELEIPVPDMGTQLAVIDKYEKIMKDISKFDDTISDINSLIQTIKENTKKLFGC